MKTPTATSYWLHRVRRKGPEIPARNARAAKAEIPDGLADGRADHQDGQDDADGPEEEAAQVGAARRLVLKPLVLAFDPFEDRLLLLAVRHEAARGAAPRCTERVVVGAPIKFRARPSETAASSPTTRSAVRGRRAPE